MTIYVYYERSYDYGIYNIFQLVFEKIQLSYPHLKFRYIDSSKIRKGTHFTEGPACKFSPLFMIFENNVTRKYLVVSFWDQLEEITIYHKDTHWDIDNCIEILTSVGAHERNGGLHSLPTLSSYVPISYMCFTTESEDHIEKCLDVTKTVPDKPLFRGQLYDYREWLLNDPRFTIFSEEDRLTPREYIEELAASYLNFSINGAGEISHREVEIMGLGTALIRTKFAINLHEPLIPDYHYIAVEWEDLDQSDSDMSKFWNPLSDRIIDKFELVKKDLDYLKFIGENGREWYTRNGSFENNARIICELLDINSLVEC